MKCDGCNRDIDIGDDDVYGCEGCSFETCQQCYAQCASCERCPSCCECRVCDLCDEKQYDATNADCPCHDSLCIGCSHTCKGCLRVRCSETHTTCGECGECDDCCECVECTVCGDKMYGDVADCECEYVCGGCAFKCDSVHCKGDSSEVTCVKHTDVCKECGLCHACCDHCVLGCSRKDPLETMDKCQLCGDVTTMCVAPHSGGVALPTNSCYFCYVWCEGCTDLVDKNTISLGLFGGATHVCDYWYDTIEGCPKCSPHLMDDINTHNIPNISNIIASYLSIAPPSTPKIVQKPRKRVRVSAPSLI